MSEYYKLKRAEQEKISKIAGAVLTVLAHVVIAVFGVFTGLKYIYPPPEEKTILIDFTEDEVIRPRQERTGTVPKAANADPTRNINLVQSSEAQHVGTRQNEAPEATVGEDGDVEVPEPPREKEIDRRALFHAADNKTEKDTLAAQTAAKVTEALKAGHAQGNTRTGKTDSEPNARLKGRSVLGNLPKPSYGAKESGKVVVKIWVDQYGNVQRAIPGDEGTTVTDKTLWNSARVAAMEAHFNMDANAPALQQGTITYIFKVTK